MRRRLLLLGVASLALACGAPSDSVDVQQEMLRGGGAGARGVECCRQKFPPGRRPAMCIAEGGKGCLPACTGSNRCPVIESLTPRDPVIFNFNNTPVTAVVKDPDAGDVLTYEWSATAGAFYGESASASPVYQCEGAGVQTVTVTVSDGNCSTSMSTEVTCLASCGNGEVEPGEECDRARTGPDGLQCSETCQFLTCGNGVLDPGEQCDPPESGLCSMTCQTAFCGNGVVDPGELCDPPSSGICSGTCQAPPAPLCSPPSPGAWRVVQQFASTVRDVWASSPTEAWLTTAYGRDPVTGQAIASEVFRWNGAAWLRILGDDVTRRYEKIWGTGPNDVWITGDRVRHWDGSSWADRTPPLARATDGSIHVRGSGSSDVWVTLRANGSFGSSIWHWNGAAWEDRTPPVPAERVHSYADLWVVSSTDVWMAGTISVLIDGTGAVGESSVIAHWDGVTWSQSSGAEVPSLTSLWGAAGDNVWGSAYRGLVHFDGQTWSKATLPTLEYVNKLWGSCPTDVWATGAPGLHFDGGTWFVDEMIPREAGPISGTSADDVWVGRETFAFGRVTHDILHRTAN